MPAFLAVSGWGVVNCSFHIFRSDVANYFYCSTTYNSNWLLLYILFFACNAQHSVKRDATCFLCKPQKPR